MKLNSLLKGAVFLGAALCGQLALAACLTAEVESNNTATTANTGVCSGTPVTGTISSSSDYDWFKIDVAAAGTINISLSHASGIDLDWYLYNSTTGTYVTYKSTSSNPEVGSYAAPAAGSYYIRVKNYSGTGAYTLTTTFPTTGGGGGGGGGTPGCLTAETESNNTIPTANTGLCSGTSATGSISASTDVDYYKIDVLAAGTINISLSHASGADFDWYLYPATGSYVASKSTSSNPETGSYSVTAAGTYYVQVKPYSGTGTYTLNVTYPNTAGGGGGGGGTTPCTLPAAVNLGKTGSTSWKPTTTTGGTVLMGGGLDVDEAISWMIAKSGGGDFVVIRSTGTNAYNDYIYGLGGVNSVQTLLITSTSQANDTCVVNTIKNAGAVFLAGGNQADYINYFKGQGVGTALNYLISTKHAPIGGTSAGMAIMGQYYHPGGAPEDATVLNNPTTIAIGNNFLANPVITNLVTEPHFAQRSRQPRLTSFLASSIYNFSVPWANMHGVSADENTAVAIDTAGLGKVFGTGNANFVKATGAPETLAPGSKLTWNVGGHALNVYQVTGTSAGTNTFNLSTWTGTSGAQHYWYVNNGTLTIN